jgi:hypothetical protein
MPIHEFKCPAGHVTERVFLTFGAAEETEVIACEAEVEHGTLLIGGTTRCGTHAHKVEWSTPLPAMLLGNPAGYHKPSPTQRHSYKHADKNRGNEWSAG